MTLAGTLGQDAVVAVLVCTPLYCLWRGYQAEHPKAPRGGETWQWDEPPQGENPAERANATTGLEAHPEA